MVAEHTRAPRDGSRCGPPPPGMGARCEADVPRGGVRRRTGEKSTLPRGVIGFIGERSVSEPLPHLKLDGLRTGDGGAATRGESNLGLIGLPSTEARTSTEWKAPAWPVMRSSLCHERSRSTRSSRFPPAGSSSRRASFCRSR